MDRFYTCPKCGRKVRLNADEYMYMAVHIRCRKCHQTWWVEVRPDEAGDDIELIGHDPDYREAIRLARFIVQEIKLYHEQEIKEAKSREEVLKAVENDLELARKHYMSRIPPRIKDRERLFEEAIEKYLLTGKK